MKLALMAGTSPFAHLLGRRAASGKKAEEGDDTAKDEKDKDAKKSAKKAETEDGDGAEPDDDAADEVVDDATEEGEDEVTGDDDGDGTKEDDDELADENEIVDKKDAKGKAKGKGAVTPRAIKQARMAGRRAERARCAAIFKSPHAGVNPAAAAHLAFETHMSAENAIGMLAAFVAPDSKQASGGLRGRVSPNPGVGAGDGGEGGKATLAAQIVAAGKKRRGETT